jgi:glyoxylate reductase
VADLPLLPEMAERLAPHVELLPWLAPGDARFPDVAAIYTFGHPTVDAAMIDRLPNIRVISNYGVGVDHIDLPAAAARGVPVGNTPGVLDGATADMAFTLLMAAARRLGEGERYARGPHYLHHDPGYMLGKEVHGAVLGILGMGRIGRQVARRAAGFDMTVLYHNRQPLDESLRQGARYVTKEELLAQSDYVVIATPLTAETRGLVGARELEQMKQSAVLVNIARGPIVDTDALTAALSARRIYGAGLDVTDPEPLPRDHPLLRLENVVVAPHLGSATTQTRGKMADLSIENLLAGLAGEPLRYRVV